MTFIANLWTICTKAPKIIAIIKAILDVIGSEQVQKILTAISDALNKETPTPESLPKTEQERIRLVDRIRRCMAMKDLGISEADLADLRNDNSNFV